METTDELHRGRTLDSVGRRKQQEGRQEQQKQSSYNFESESPQDTTERSHGITEP